MLAPELIVLVLPPAALALEPILLVLVFALVALPLAAFAHFPAVIVLSIALLLQQSAAAPPETALRLQLLLAPPPNPDALESALLVLLRQCYKSFQSASLHARTDFSPSLQRSIIFYNLTRLGSSMRNVVPRANWLSTAIVPRIIRTKRSTIDNPKPVPPCLRLMV